MNCVKWLCIMKWLCISEWLCIMNCMCMIVGVVDAQVSSGKILCV